MLRILSHAAVQRSALIVVGGFCAEVAVGRDEDLFVRPADQRTVTFGSIDVGRSVFVSVGAKQAVVGSLDRSGFVVMESAGLGVTRERLGGLAATRLTTQSSVLVGQQWNLPKVFLSGFLGPELQHEQLAVGGRVAPFSKPRYGLRGHADLWSNPTPATLLTATVVAGSARGSIWARGSGGVKVGGGVFAGPEVTAYATESYREIKVGGHLTGWRLGLVRGRLSAGWTMTDDGRPGAPYFGATAWIRM